MKSIGLARLGRDAEIRHTNEGTPVCNLALAYNYGRKDQSGDQPTQWVQGSLWGKRAEALTQYLTKGTAIVVTLSDLHIDHFTKQDGTTGTALKARVDDLEFAGAKTQGQQNQAPQQTTDPGLPGPDLGATDGMNEDPPF